MKRWTKDATASSERIDDACISSVRVESLLKKVLLRKTLDVINGAASVQELCIMAAIQALCPSSHEEIKNAGTAAATPHAAAFPSELVPMSCPSQTVKGGRPPNSGLKSWLVGQKRKCRQDQVDSAAAVTDWPDEEAPRNRKMKLISDIV